MEPLIPLGMISPVLVGLSLMGIVKKNGETSPQHNGIESTEKEYVSRQQEWLPPCLEDIMA